MSCFCAFSGSQHSFSVQTVHNRILKPNMVLSKVNYINNCIIAKFGNICKNRESGSANSELCFSLIFDKSTFSL